MPEPFGHVDARRIAGVVASALTWGDTCGTAVMLGLTTTQLEWLALAGAVLVAVTVPRWVQRVASPLLRAFEQLGRRPLVASLVFAAATFAGAFACAWLVQWPMARVHDEYSYLLAADTFAAGRLCFPAPPCAEQLESFHVITTPVYASKYPSGQGLALALGQALGDPALGVWFSAALFVGALAWMLLGFLPARWALLGASVALLRYATTSYWAQSYWGGALTAAGAALAFGALVRIWRRGSFALGAVLGLGVALLALTRPFEGAVACAPLAFALAWWSWRRAREAELGVVARTFAGAAVPLAASLVWMAVLNRAITGDPLRMPYFLHDAQYAVAPPFLWLEAAPAPHFATREIGEFWTGFAYELWAQQQSFAGFLERAAIKLGAWWSYFIGAPLTLALLVAPFALRGRWLRFGALVIASVAVGVLSVAYDLPHYLAPAAPWIVAVCVGGLRVLASVRPLRRARRGSAIVIAVLGVLSVECVVRGALRERPEHSFERERARIEEELTLVGRKAVVIVQYAEGHNVHDDWVFNRADLDAAHVIWARDHGEAARERLRACFPERSGYLLSVGRQGPAQRTALWP